MALTASPPRQRLYAIKASNCVFVPVIPFAVSKSAERAAGLETQRQRPPIERAAARSVRATAS